MRWSRVGSVKKVFLSLHLSHSAGCHMLGFRFITNLNSNLCTAKTKWDTTENSVFTGRFLIKKMVWQWLVDKDENSKLENSYTCCIRLCFFNITLAKNSAELHLQDTAAPQPNASFTGLRVLLVIHSQWCDPLTCEITTEVAHEDSTQIPFRSRVLFVWGLRSSNFRDYADIAGQNRSLKRSIQWMCADQNQEHLVN